VPRCRTAGGHIRQEDWHVVRPALVHRRPRIWTDEQRPVPEVRRHPRGQVRTRALRVEMDHPDIAKVVGARDKSIQQDGRRRRGAMDIDLVAAPNPGDGFWR
jgi:hypothetical protein